MTYAPDLRRYEKQLEILRLMSAPVGRQMQENVRRAIEGLAATEKSRYAAEQLAATRQVRRAAQELLNKPGLNEAIAKAITAYPPPGIQSLVDEVARAFSPARLQISEQIAAAGLSEAQLSRAAARFEAEAAHAGGLPEDARDNSLGWWLVTRSPAVQLGLLREALNLLIGLTVYLETRNGENVAASTLAAAHLCVAIVLFMLTWLEAHGD